jgi:membrane associated rhomboid family serine protease
LNQRSYSGNSSPLSDTPVSFGIIILCAIIFFTGFRQPGMALWPLESGYFTPWQLLTYGFLHGNFNGAGSDSFPTTWSAWSAQRWPS